jgi:hypothetical protein
LTSPLIFIPIINEQTFECLDDHVDKLRQLLKNTENVLIVGWSAAEKHFIDLIKATVTRELRVEAVCGRHEYSLETLDTLVKQGIRIMGKVFDGGFTEYVKSREAERFFS